MTDDADRPYRRLALRGAVDLHRVIALRIEVDTVLAARPSTLGLDLSETTFIDCAGLAGLLWCVRRAQAVGARVVLVSPSPAVLRMLTVTDSRRCFALAS